MKLLISVNSVTEAQAARQGGADIIDVKNPAEGALGTASVSALRDIRAALPTKSIVSAALGESNSAPGVLALAGYGAATFGVRYVKLGLLTPVPTEAITLLQQVQAALHLANPECALIAVGYADATEIGALPWKLLPEVARAARIHGCMIDTALKDGHHLFDHCAEAALARWITACREARLLCALAGSLSSTGYRPCAACSQMWSVFGGGLLGRSG
ncbi:MAG: (5-formylfuran-3-yl)methyl phosphate synthase [Anaerolineae bacterium]